MFTSSNLLRFCTFCIGRCRHKFRLAILSAPKLPALRLVLCSKNATVELGKGSVSIANEPVREILGQGISALETHVVSGHEMFPTCGILSRHGGSRELVIRRLEKIILEGCRRAGRFYFLQGNPLLPKNELERYGGNFVDSEYR